MSTELWKRFRESGRSDQGGRPVRVRRHHAYLRKSGMPMSSTSAPVATSPRLLSKNRCVHAWPVRGRSHAHSQGRSACTMQVDTLCLKRCALSPRR